MLTLVRYEFLEHSGLAAFLMQITLNVRFIPTCLFQTPFHSYFSHTVHSLLFQMFAFSVFDRKAEDQLSTFQAAYLTTKNRSFEMQWEDRCLTISSAPWHLCLLLK